jgi:hypothetical protein
MGPIVSWPRVYADLKRVGGRGTMLPIISAM